MISKQSQLIVAASLCAAVMIPSIASAAGRDGHIPLVNPGSGPSGRTLPAMPTPNYGAPATAATIPTLPSRPTGVGSDGVTGTPAMTMGRPNSKAISRFSR